MEFLLEIIIEILFAPFFEISSGRLKKRFTGEKNEIDPLVILFSLIAFGFILGLLSLVFFKKRVYPVFGFKGMSLFLSPILGGLIMKAYGLIRNRFHKKRSVLGTFYGGALFAFSIAFVRFVLVGKV